MAHLNNLISKTNKIYNKSLVGLIDDCKNELLSNFFTIQKMCQDKDTSQPDKLEIKGITRHGRSKSEKTYRNGERSNISHPTIVIEEYRKPSNDISKTQSVKPSACGHGTEESIKVENEHLREDRQKCKPKEESVEEPITVSLIQLRLVKSYWTFLF